MMPLTHLLRSLTLGRDSESVHAALMLTAYFDESGHASDHQTIVIAGFVASITQWEVFDIAWKNALSDVPYFHMKEFVRELAPYTNWDKDRRRRFMTGLIDALLLLPQSFSVSITVDAYNKANEVYWLDKFVGKPWSVCAINCVASVEQWHKKQAKDPIEYIFHQVPKKTGQGHLKEMMARQNLTEPIFRPSEKLSGLQAADLLAWETHKFFESSADSTFKDYRIPYVRLFEKFNKHWYAHYDTTPVQMCIDNNVPIREPGVTYVKRKGEWYQQRRIERI
jgi:hypothetical protein